MTLQDLLKNYRQHPATNVPDWMLGCFRRHCISFSNGESDTSTVVFWFQSCNFTIDLRLPSAVTRAPALALADCSPDDLLTLADYEGWFAQSDWDGAMMTWHSETSLQSHNRWPEPAQLHRVGNCMMEFAPSGAYVEDWRLQPSAPGPLVGLRLLEERNLTRGKVLHRGGGLIICGDYAALVKGRAGQMTEFSVPLVDKVSVATSTELINCFAFEASVARGSLDLGYTVQHSTVAMRSGEPLFAVEDTDWQRDGEHILQTLRRDGDVIELRFEIDVLCAQYDFAQSSAVPESANAWFTREARTLTRYTRSLTDVDLFKPLDLRRFAIPTFWQGSHVVLLAASPRWAEADLEAVHTSLPALQQLFGRNDAWPPANLTLSENTADLAWHAEEFTAGRSFAYHLMDLCRQRCLGCLYIYPTASLAHDAEAYLWVRSDQGPDRARKIREEVINWVNTHWNFRSLVWPGRSISFERWQEFQAPNYFHKYRFADPIAPRRPITEAC